MPGTVRGDVHAWLAFVDAAGVDISAADEPRPWTAVNSLPTPAEAVPVRSPPRPSRSARAVPAAGPAVAGNVEDARRLAAGATSLDEVVARLRTFDGCPLSRTATNLCVADGDPQSRFMLVGEAPGAEEDRQGKPFVGASGRLLDRMLAAAGQPRERTYITNTIFWRPPGNRDPSQQEIALCLPFLTRQIELLRPQVILFVGGIAARALLELKEGVTRLRGRRFSYGLADGTAVRATVMFHPAYLLRRPQLKGLAWHDLLLASSWLDADDAATDA
ncbi:MAG: uracil-DNA glycosylase [Pseudomonadota bacterium]